MNIVSAEKRNLLTTVINFGVTIIWVNQLERSNVWVFQHLAMHRFFFIRCCFYFLCVSVPDEVSSNVSGLCMRDWQQLHRRTCGSTGGFSSKNCNSFFLVSPSGKTSLRSPRTGQLSSWKSGLLLVSTAVALAATCSSEVAESARDERTERR